MAFRRYLYFESEVERVWLPLKCVRGECYGT